MKKICIAAALAGTLCSPLVFAQAQRFEGFALGLNVNSSNASTDFTANSQTFKPTETSSNFAVQLGYGFLPSDKFVLGVGATFSGSELKAGSATTGGITYELKQKDLYSVYVEPGFMIGESTIGYGKLAYVGMRGESRLSTGLTVADDYVGAGYGLGLRTVFGNNVYLQAEVMQNNYNERSGRGLVVKPSSTMGTIGIGYKF
jgi:opacity protein-like surface antigen